MRLFWSPAILFCLFATSLCSAQGRFFWSDRGFGEGAESGPHLTEVGLGFTKEIFLYYDTSNGNDISDGFSFDFSFDQSDRCLFTSANVFNFDITISGTPIGSRWEIWGADVSENSIENFFAVNTGDQFGILQSNGVGGVFIDEGYDSTADAFLVGSFSVAAIASTDGVPLELQYDMVQVANDGQLVDVILEELFIIPSNDCILAAPNDLWADSVEIDRTDFPFPWFGTNNYSFTESGEQQLAETGSTVWFHLTAAADGIMTVDTTTYLTEYDTQLHIYTGAELGFPNLIPVANNNDVNGTAQSRVSFPVLAGQRYEIRVGGFDDGSGSGKKNGDGEEGCIRMNLDLLENAIPGDINCDGDLNLLDVSPFVERVVSGSYDPKADVNFDGEVNLLDVNPFVVLIGG